MHSPRTLILAITATACGFLLALVAVMGQAAQATAPAVQVALAPRIVAAVAHDVRHAEPVPYSLALESATSHPQAR